MDLPTDLPADVPEVGIEPGSAAVQDLPRPCGSCGKRFATTRGLMRHLALSVACSRHTQLSVQRQAVEAAARASLDSAERASAQQLKSSEKLFRGDMQDTVLDGLSRLRIDAL
eukprot:1760173-Pleurochrysis_carterae.AAC.1